MNWQSFKALFDLYETGTTKNRLSLGNCSIFGYHTHQTKELLFTKKEIIVRDRNSFERAFRNRYLDKYNRCLELLNAIGENTPQCRFEVDDILRLSDMSTQMENGELEEIRQQIIDSNETRRGVSLMFFKNEKHLESSEALERSVKKILQIETFADNRDYQYLYVLQCHTPKVILLCENLYFLKMPDKARSHHIELWYAGGRNVDKLKYVGNRDIPIYYLCDWDYDGLDIYKSVKEMIPHIELLTPNGTPKGIVETEHKSLWRDSKIPSLLSGLPSELYTEEQKQLIEMLIKENSWIVEESNDLIELIDNQYFES